MTALGRASLMIVCLATLPLAAPAAEGPDASFAGTLARQVRDDNGLNMKLCWCPRGTFTMGSPEGEPDRDDKDEDQVQGGFWLGKHELTQSQWQAVIETTLEEQRVKASVLYEVPCAARGRTTRCTT